MVKIGFLFGAGAEVPYNMPTGGTFALDIFRQDSSESKDEFKKMREQINSNTAYATEWLPQGYDEKNIFVFGKSVFENIIKDTVEHNRDKIINSLTNLDGLSLRTIKKIETTNNEIDINETFEKILSQPIDNVSCAQDIRLKTQFHEGDALFQSHYFSALLLIYKSANQSSYKGELGQIIVSILQLLLGSLGENLARQINDSPFDKKDDEIDLFDDLGELFQLNYSFAGVSGLRYLFERKDRYPSLDSDDDIILFFAETLLESIFADVLDYKTLIDSYWHYLYCPKLEWSKFCKISIFLLTVRNYIKKQCGKINNCSTGYYDDLVECLEKNIEITAIAITNYTDLIKNKVPDKLRNQIYFLNGYTEQWYDPYINRIGPKEDLNCEEKHFLVPLLFTQSGTKPMTSIFMSKAYVSVFEEFKNADAICSVGFGFNSDDEHINGIIRELINSGKQLIVVTPNHNQDKSQVARNLVKKLKLTKSSNIHVILVNKERKGTSDFWIDEIKNIVKDINDKEKSKIHA